MAGPAESREPWERLAAELRAYGQGQRQAWGDLDDIQVARYLGGACSPQERAEVEQAMRDLPDAREVIDLLRGLLPGLGLDRPVEPGSGEGTTGASRRAGAPAGQSLEERQAAEVAWAAARAAALARGTVVGGQAAGTQPAPGRRVLRRAALIGLGLAASFLLGWLAAVSHVPSWQLQSSGQPFFELLLASLTAVPRDSRSPEAARVMLDDQGVYRIAGGKDFALEIRSPREGVATLVLLGPGEPVVYPLPGQGDIAVEPLEPRKFGPLDRPEGRTAVLVIVTATPAAEMVRQHLASAGAAQDQPERLLAHALWAGGQRWAALGRIAIEPVERP
jgi:hypothetical protein